MKQYRPDFVVFEAEGLSVRVPVSLVRKVLERKDRYWTLKEGTTTVTFDPIRSEYYPYHLSDSEHAFALSAGDFKTQATLGLWTCGE